VKHCEQCGTAFTAKRPHARFCSDRCRWEAWLAGGGKSGAQRVEGTPRSSSKGLSQRDRVLYALRDAGEAGVRSDVFLGLSIPRAAARVCELREQGYEIASERERQFVRYRLQARRGVGDVGAHTRYEDNPITAGIARRPGRSEEPGDKTEVPAAAPEDAQPTLFEAA
jgi:hypothetical protein